MRAHERWSEHTKHLQPLVVGDKVCIQNQFGKYPTKWDKTGVVIEVRQHDRYMVKVDGSGRMTTSNRKFLRKYLPVVPSKLSITINTDIEYKRILENPGIRPLPFKNNDPPAPVLPTPENNYQPYETPMSLHGEVPIRVQTPDLHNNEDRTPEIVLDNPPPIQRDNPLPIKMDNPPLPQAKSPQPPLDKNIHTHHPGNPLGMYWKRIKPS